MVLAFVGGHVAYSFAAPIALVEALAPDRRTEPWLGVGGLVVAGLAYAAAAALVLVDHLRTEASHASGAQVAGCLVVAAVLIAWGLRRRASPPLDQGRRAPRPITTGVVAFVVASVQAVAPETWLRDGAVAGGDRRRRRVGRPRVARGRLERAARHGARQRACCSAAPPSRSPTCRSSAPCRSSASTPDNVVMAALIVGMAALAARAARRHDATPAA